MVNSKQIVIIKVEVVLLIFFISSVFVDELIVVELSFLLFELSDVYLFQLSVQLLSFLLNFFLFFKNGLSLLIEFYFYFFYFFF